MLHLRHVLHRYVGKARVWGGRKSEWKQVFSLADQLDNALKDQTQLNVEYDLFLSEDMKETGKILGDVMKPGAHAHVSCSGLPITLRYVILALKDIEERSSTGKGPRDAEY